MRSACLFLVHLLTTLTVHLTLADGNPAIYIGALLAVGITYLTAERVLTRRQARLPRFELRAPGQADTLTVIEQRARRVIWGLVGAATASPAPPKGYVSRSQLGKDWPLTVEDGVLGCNASSATITTGGQKYALNGTARTWRDGAPVDPIWAPNPDVPGLKKNIGVLIDRALALC